jgi:hypothetical protein
VLDALSRPQDDSTNMASKGRVTRIVVFAMESIAATES